MGINDTTSPSEMIFTEQNNHVDENNIKYDDEDANADEDPLKEQQVQQQQHEAKTEPPKSKDELIRMLSERHILQLTPEEDELLDPIERTVRYLIPIPKYYYWDVMKEHANHNSTKNSEVPNEAIITSDQIPYTIRSWHTIINLCDRIGTWTNTHIAQPIASYTGLTGPRFHEVLTSMTPQEMQQSQRIVHERQVRDEIHRQV
jgi:hypothetical protein